MSARRAFRAAAQTRRDDVSLLVDLYNGAQTEILNSDIDKNYEQVNTRNKLKAAGLTLNLTKWVIDESSAALRKPPVIRVLIGEDDITDTWSALDERGQFGVILREGERYANLVNDVAIMPAVREKGERAFMRWDLFTPDRYAVSQDPDAPSEPSSIALYFLMSDGEAQESNAGGYIVWTPETVAVYDRDGRNVTPQWLPDMAVGQTAANPYGWLPVGIMRSSVPLFGEFYGPMAGDLGNYNRQLNMLATEMRLTERMQGFGQLVIINPSEDMKEKLAVGQVTPISIRSREDSPGDAKFISPGAPLTELQEAKARMVKEIATRYGLNGEDFLQGKTTAASGAAKKIDNERLEAKAVEFREVSRPVIVDLVRKSLLMAKWWAGNGAKFYDEFNPADIPDDPEEIDVQVIYSDAKDMQSMEDFTLAQARCDKGLSSWAEVYMSEHPEVGTTEDAEEEIAKNLASNAASKPVNPLEEMPDMGGAPGQADPGAVQDVVMAVNSGDMTPEQGRRMLAKAGLAPSEIDELLDSQSQPNPGEPEPK